MQHFIRAVLCGLTFSVVLALPVYSQQGSAARAADLRAQLAELQTKQAQLETQLQQLDEDLKPENIERSLAGVGSTHPEELREQRRRQLEIQKKGITSQLEVIAVSRARLQAAIARADADSYLESAGPPQPAAQAQTTSGSTAKKAKHKSKKKKKKRGSAKVSMP